MKRGSSKTCGTMAGWPVCTTLPMMPFAIAVAILLLVVAGDARRGGHDQFAAVGREEHDRAANQAKPIFQERQHLGQHLPLAVLRGQQPRNFGQYPQVLFMDAWGRQTIRGRCHHSRANLFLMLQWASSAVLPGFRCQSPCQRKAQAESARRLAGISHRRSVCKNRALIALSNTIFLFDCVGSDTIGNHPATRDIACFPTVLPRNRMFSRRIISGQEVIGRRPRRERGVGELAVRSRMNCDGFAKGGSLCLSIGHPAVLDRSSPAMPRAEIELDTTRQPQICPKCLLPKDLASRRTALSNQVSTIRQEHRDLFHSVRANHATDASCFASWSYGVVVSSRRPRLSKFAAPRLF